MAGLGLGPPDFALFEIDDPDDRAAALEAKLQPKLAALGEQCLPGTRPRRRQGALRPRREGPAAARGRRPRRRSSRSPTAPKGYRGVPYLAVVVTRAPPPRARRRPRGVAPPRRDAGRARARGGEPRRRRGSRSASSASSSDWNFEELPELAPAHSAAFWGELGDELAPGGAGLDVGIAWTREEARSLSIGDLLGVFRDLSPLYKLLANAS